MALFQYALRIDKEFPAVSSFLSEKGVSGWGVRETAGDNEHWHFFLETKIKMSSMRVLLKRAVPSLSGNGAYSISDVKDVEKYQRYMAKGECAEKEPEVAWRHGLLWTDEKISELHEEYWMANRASKKRREVGVMDFVLDLCRDNGTAWDDRGAIAEEYIKELVARNKPINLFSVKSAVNLIQVKLCPTDDAIKMLSQQIHI